MERQVEALQEEMRANQREQNQKTREAQDAAARYNQAIADNDKAAEKKAMKELADKVKEKADLEAEREKKAKEVKEIERRQHE